MVFSAQNDAGTSLEELRNAVPVEYPLINISPDSPRSSIDSVSLCLILGEAQNSCYAPDYSDMSVTIERSPLLIWPPVYSVYLEYTARQLLVVCSDNYDPVMHGPQFDLGVLDEGAYHVFDATVDRDQRVGSFTVNSDTITGPLTMSIKGTVEDDPFPLKRLGFPISDVKVMLKQSESVRDDQPDIIPPGDDLVPLVTIDSAVTNSEGQFAFDNLSPGIYYICCTHSDFNQATMAVALTSDALVNIKMLSNTASGIVSGSISELSGDDLSVLDGCTVTVAQRFNDLDYTAAVSDFQSVYRTVSGSDGSYRIEGIALRVNGESWRVRAFKDGYTEEVEYVELYNNTLKNNLDFTLQKSYANLNSDTTDGVVFTIATRKMAYDVGEGIDVRYTIKNTTSRDVTFDDFSLNCEYNMTIGEQSAETPFFQLSDLTECLRTLSEIIVPAGDSVVEEFPLYIIPEDLVTGDNDFWIIAAGLRSDKYQYSWISVPVEVRNEPVKVEKPALISAVSGKTECSLSNNNISLELPSSQIVKVSAHSLDGRRIPAISFQKRFGAGPHTVTLKVSGVKGICILKISGDTFIRTFRLNPVFR